MFKTIMVPLDLTDKHGPALDRAAEIAKPAGGEVLLLHVIEEIAGLPPAEDRSFYQRLERKADDHLGRAGQQVAGHGVAWRKKILLGNRAREIIRHAADEGADLIVLTAPRFDANNPAAGWGSMSWRLSLLAPCPVLLVK